MNDDPLGSLPELDSGAASFADMAYLETDGSTADRVKAAVRAYLWAQQNVRLRFGYEVYPSLDDLRTALAEAEANR